MAKHHQPTAGLAAYLQVAKDAQAPAGTALQTQRRTITAACKAHGLEISRWFEDTGRPGVSSTRRPGLQAALAEINAGRANGLICTEINLLGRDAADVLRFIEQAQRERWRLIALDIGLDTTTPAGKLVANAILAARSEWRHISDQQLKRHNRLRQQNRPRGRAAAPREIADRILAMRTEGSTLRAIANQLNAEHIPTTRGGKEWTAATVRSALITRKREQIANEGRCVSQVPG